MKKILIPLFVFALIVAGCLPNPGSSSAPAVSNEAPVVVEAAPAESSSSSPMDKCEWLRQNFPQTTEGIQALGAKLAGVAPERIATHVFRCTPETTVFDGFIVLGPNEGYAGSFSLAVPAGGAVDTYAAAKCTGTSQTLGTATDTVRCFDGTVTAVRATYWPWLDENPPVSGGASSSTAETTGCVDPKVMATQHGWTYAGSPDQYGGLVVTLTSADTLPVDWEAVTQGHTIRESDSNRAMAKGVYTIYPPYADRECLGYSK